MGRRRDWTVVTREPSDGNHVLTITDLVKTFTGARGGDADRPKDGGTVRAVDRVSIEVQEGELFTLLGPSGCGKTTTLRCVAGLEQPVSGEIRVGERVMFSGGEDRRRLNIPPNQRGLGMVFQSYAIWPHMSVFDNVAFPLRVVPRKDRAPRKEVRRRVMEVLETMELAHLDKRPATKLSGGQQQRLALARALVIQPPLMLLDEPLSNLDAKLRESLRFELKRLQQELGITSIYVTHDQIEALTMSDRVAVMDRGRLMQVGTPQEIYQRPANAFVAEFIGTSNFIEGRARTVEDGILTVQTALGRLQVATAPPRPAAGEVVRLGIRPETIRLTPLDEEPLAPNELSGRVVARAFMGDAVDHLVDIGGTELRSRGNPATVFNPGDEVVASLDRDGISLIPVTPAAT